MSIDRNSPTWFALAKHVDERIEELKERCCLVTTSDATRADCAARIDELRRLLAPATPVTTIGAPYRSESY